MGKLKIFLIGIFLSILFIFINKYFYLEIEQVNKINFGRKINFYGEIFLKEGNNMPKLPNINLQKSTKFKHIIAVEGKLKRVDDKAEVDIKNIHKKFLKIKSKGNGDFVYLLKPGNYTFLIELNDKGYLNKFDGYGFFQSYVISKKNNKVKLIYDKNLLN